MRHSQWTSALSLVVLSSTTVGCLGIGEGVLRARGTLSHPAASATSCRLHLKVHATGETVLSISVSGEFEEGFLIAPKEDEYVLAVVCSDGSSFVSPPFKADGITYFETPYDLGEIEFGGAISFL